MKRVNNYFSHDFNARNDLKLRKLSMEMGMEGIGIYWCIVEALYENNGYLTFKEDIDLLSYEFRVKRQKIEKVIKEFSLFEIENDKFYSPRILESIEKITNKSKKNSENVKKRWEKSRGIGNNGNNDVIPINKNGNTNVSQTNYYIKENKIKENKINNKDILLTTTTTTNNIYDYVQENFGRTLSPIEYEKINKWLTLFDEEMFKYAIDIAVINNKKTIAYVNGILNNWQSNGYKTIAEIKEADTKKESADTPSSPNNEVLDNPDIQELLDSDYDWMNDPN